jgi:hypothetical protein
MIQQGNAISVCRGPVTYVGWWSIDDAHTLITVEAGRDVNELESTRMKLDRELDEALEETFPASDPPSITREP